ncbi:MAG: hypothetical protein R3E65_09455 [Steroidobacteraceae bacterium]
MNDLALGAIVLVIAAMPAALLLLALFDVIRVGDQARRRWLVVGTALAALPGLGWLAISVWGWAGAAHLEPLCVAYATPEYRGRLAPEARSLLLVTPAGDPQPAWSRALLGGPAGLEFVEWRDSSGALLRIDARGATPVAGPVQSAYALELRRITHHTNRWFRVEMERLRLVDRTWDVTIAEGDELRLSAGRSIWHCGIASGRNVARAPTAAETDAGIGTFIRTALRGPRPAMK